MTKEDFHLHSNFSDGENSLEEMTKKAIDLGYKKIAFADHVRKETTWIKDYLKAIKKLKNKYKKEIKILKNKYKKEIKILAGIEAKVVNLKGDLDLPENFPKEIDLVFGSFHRIPKRERVYFEPEEISLNKKRVLNNWYKAMLNLLKNPQVKIIAHPTYILDKYSITLPSKFKKEISKKAKLNNKIFEINLKWNTLDKEFLSYLKKAGVKLVQGSDSHSTKELEYFSKQIKK